MLSTKDPPQKKRYTLAKSKGMKKDISYKWKWGKCGIAILIYDKINFKTKASPGQCGTVVWSIVPQTERSQSQIPVRA